MSPLAEESVQRVDLGGYMKWLQRAGEREMLSDRAVLMLMDAPDETEFGQRLEMLRDEAGRRLHLPQERVNGWLKEAVERYHSDPAAFGAAVQAAEAEKARADELLLNPWPLLEPFEEAYDQGEAFPVDSLGNVLRDYVLAVAESLQVPVDMVGTICLGMLSAGVQGKWCIGGGGDWSEPLNLFVCVVAEPAERKSAALKRMAGPLKHYEMEQNRLNALEIKQSQAMHTALERKVSSVQEKFSKGKAKEDELLAAVAELEGHQVRHECKLVTSDVTPEKLAALMDEHEGRMALFSAEGGIFDMMLGKRYGNGGPNFDVFLNGHAGDLIQVDRLGRPPISISDPCLTMALMVQPVVLERLVGNPDFRRKGLVARFLYSYPTTALGRRKTRTRRVPDGLEQAYGDILEQLLDIQVPRQQRGFLRLSREARDYLDRYRDYIEQGLDKETGAYRNMTDWAGKLPGAVLRMAGILHCVRYRCEGVDLDRIPVECETMERAVELGNYYLAMASGIYARSGADGTTAGARKLWERIREKGYRSQITRDDIGKVGRRLFENASERGKAVEELVARGYLRIFDPPTGAVFPTTGRPKTVYEIRPEREMGKVIRKGDRSA